MSMKPLRAALYHRASTLDQNPALCREELRAAAGARGASVVLDIEETGTGRRNDRPGLQQVMEAARRHHIDLVIVWRLNRFGRSMLDLLANIKELQRVGVRFVSSSQGIEIGPQRDAMTNLVVGILAALAEFDSEQISEGTLLGMADARRRGVHLGRPRKEGPTREAVEAVLATGVSRRQAARQLGCGPWHVQRVLKRVVDLTPKSERPRDA